MHGCDSTISPMYVEEEEEDDDDDDNDDDDDDDNDDDDASSSSSSLELVHNELCKISTEVERMRTVYSSCH